MPNNQAHDPRVATAGERVAQAVGLSVAAVAGGGGSGALTDNGDGTLTLAGSGFGSKAQAAPILADYVDTAYENGVENPVAEAYSDGQYVPGVSDNGNTLYINNGATFRYSTSRSMRHSGQGKSYFLSGNSNMFVGRARAYGTDGSPPPGRKPLYYAYWLRTDQDFPYQWDISPEEAPSGPFTPGEAILVDGQYAGRYIDEYSTQEIYGRFLIEISGGGALANYKGSTIVGQTSGNTMVFPVNFRAGSGTGYEYGGTKFMRIWDEQSAADLTGIECSVAVNDWYINLSDADGGGQAFKNNTNIDLSPLSDFHFIEIELDLQKGLMRHWVDRQLRGENTFATTYGDDNFSPTVTLLGLDGGPVSLAEVDISEVYQDQTWQRVYFADAPEWANVTKVELQRPIAWSDTSITFARYDGALTGTKWVYVLDADGQPVSTSGVEVV